MNSHIVVYPDIFHELTQALQPFYHNHLSPKNAFEKIYQIIHLGCLLIQRNRD